MTTVQTGSYSAYIEYVNNVPDGYGHCVQAWVGFLYANWYSGLGWQFIGMQIYYANGQSSWIPA